MSTEQDRRLQAAIPAGVWAADVEQRYPIDSTGRKVADSARREFEQLGVPEHQLQACEPEGPDGTRLEGCLKVYLPFGPRDPYKRPFGMVFIDVGQRQPALVLLAFGHRHPSAGTHSASVYRRAHRRLHP